MISADDIRKILSNIRYKDWTFHFNPEQCYVQIQFDDVDVITGKMERQHCRKWKLSYHMTTSEIVRSAYKAVLAAEEHEAAERFTYKNTRVFDPHVDVEALVELHSKGYVQDVRS